MLYMPISQDSIPQHPAAHEPHLTALAHLLTHAITYARDQVSHRFHPERLWLLFTPWDSTLFAFFTKQSRTPLALITRRRSNTAFITA